MEPASGGRRNVDTITIGVTPAFGWSVGNYMERFFDGLREGKFLGTKCPKCGRVYLPPRMVCEQCFVEMEDWVDLGPSGTIETYTVASVEVGKDGDLHELEEPVIIGMIKHEGADTCLVAKVEDVDPADLEVGMKVEAILVKDAERVLDVLSHYVPLR